MKCTKQSMLLKPTNLRQRRVANDLPLGNTHHQILREVLESRTVHESQNRLATLMGAVY